jgi:8-oxo-dGTP diphosphatase
MPNTGPEAASAMPAPGAQRRHVHVAAAAVADGNGCILIQRRPVGVHQGGLWEFPGGKLEPGECAEEALARELLEELGIRLRRFRPLIRTHHDYGDRHVVLDVFRVDEYDGDPVGREGQPLAWVAPDAMDATIFPAADRPVINALRLPSLYLITGDDPEDPDTFCKRLERALSSGLRLVQLRAHQLPDSAFAALARRAFPLCRAAGARLLLNRNPALVAGLPCDGVHLSTPALRRLSARPVAPSRLVGASCHDAEELDLAQRLGLDYALLSPIKATDSHPAAPALEWSGFSSLVEPVCLPVYALGGLGSDDLVQCFAHGGQGVAAIRALWPR